MRVLLDECVPRPLREELPGHDVKTVAESGWSGAKNGELLRLAAQRFDVLLTVDDIVDLKPLMPAVLQALPTAPRGKATNIR